jgi:hypothetical protein
MEGPVAKTKTSERLFFLPGNADNTISTQTGSSELANVDDNRFPARLSARRQSARSYIRTAFIAIPTAYNSEVERGTVFLFLPVFAGTVAISISTLEWNRGSAPSPAFAGGEAACNEESVLVISRRDLASRGAAEIELSAAQHIGDTSPANAPRPGPE